MRKQTKIAALVSAAALLAIGASMTSFADWVGPLEDGSYEYHDSDGIAVTDEWRTGKSSRDGQPYYYYLDSDGKMATDTLVESGEHLYYVNENGEKATNYWYKVENTEAITVNEITPTYLYYYFDKNGQALTGGRKEAYKSNTDQTKTYFYFDDEGHMMSGWINDTYYCSGEDEGYMLTGWQELTVPAEVVDSGEPVNPDTDTAWYYFGSDGKMYKSSRSYLPMSNTNSKKTWFEFDENGCLLENKWGKLPATLNDAGRVVEGTIGYYYVEDGYAADGWVKADYDGAEADTNDDHSETWFYFTNGKAYNFAGEDAEENYNPATASNATNIKSIKVWNEDNGGFESVEGDATLYAARSIKGKTYLFNEFGEYVTGVYKIEGTVYRKGSSQSIGDGIYYFDLANDKEGSMKTNKQVVTNQYEESRNYLFESSGKAVTDQIKGGVLYDHNGLREDAEEGSWQIIYISDLLSDGSKSIVSDKDAVTDEGKKYAENKKYVFEADDRIIVSASGRVKESGSVTIDGTKYYIKTAAKGTKTDDAKDADGKLDAAINGETYVIVHQYNVD